MSAEPNTQAESKRTPLYEEHKKLSARFTEFGGWTMPVSYSGVIDEHQTVRTAAGLFDVSHMGEIFVRGPKASEFLEHVSTNKLASLENGRAQYSLLLNEEGGVIDDIIIYRFSSENFLICVNAGNSEIDWQWLQKCNKAYGAELENASPRFGQVALQGPKARAILSKSLHKDPARFSPEAFPAFSFREEHFPLGSGKESTVIVACTGYTGEDGFELFCPADATPAIWQVLLSAGGAEGLKPAGLGARDSLRLEACYPLHGHELSPKMNPLSSGLAWVIDLGKNFIGKAAVLKAKEDGLAHRLVGLEVVDPGIVREGAELFSEDGEKIGWVTSGTKPPTVNKSVALAFVRPSCAGLGTPLKADVRGKLLRVLVIKKPFYKRQAEAKTALL